MINTYQCELFSAQHLRDIFYRMGFNDQEIVALSGAHALGRCHATASGYVGPWTPTPETFNNLYFVLLKGTTAPSECYDMVSIVRLQDSNGLLTLRPPNSNTKVIDPMGSYCKCN